LTQNNQEAAILVGEKYPIIESQNNGSAGGSTAVTSTTLSYYENIGIQLNVIPQICADDYINMIVHPTVSSIDGFVGGGVTTGTNTQSGTLYPRLKVREAQTQVMLRSQDTIAIGGLQNEVDEDSRYGVPFLMDIPFLGRLFRRDTTTTQKIDLLILIKATIIDDETYGAESQQMQQKKLEAMEMEFVTESVEPMEVDVVEMEIFSDTEEIGEVEPVVAEEDVVAEEVVVEEVSESSVENEEILALVNSMDEPTTNATVNAEL
jgi:type II secretory pathway component GspD/PulD (secretin)